MKFDIDIVLGRVIMGLALRQMNAGYTPCVQMVDPFEPSLSEGCFLSVFNHVHPHPICIPQVILVPALAWSSRLPQASSVAP